MDTNRGIWRMRGLSSATKGLVGGGANVVVGDDRLYGVVQTETTGTTLATPPTRPFVAEKSLSSSQIPLFVSITIARLLHYLRIHTPHTAYIGGNLTS